ncbi:MAG: hypothetical protein ABFC77_05790 [Thermoguttaceae bacterium]
MSEFVDRVWPAELVEDICDLAKGPTRPVLKKAAETWLEGHKQRLSESREKGDDGPHLPYPKRKPGPNHPLTLSDFNACCAILAAVHDPCCESCEGFIWPEPPHDDHVGSVVWLLLRQEVNKKPAPAYVRKILDFVHAELLQQGVLSPAKPEQKGSGVSPPDGPIKPDVFVWKGVSYRGLARKPFLTLQYVWECENHTALHDDTMAAVVNEDHEAQFADNAVRGLRQEINSFFRKNRLPFHARQKNGCLNIESVALTPAARVKRAEAKPIRRRKK